MDALKCFHQHTFYLIDGLFSGKCYIFFKEIITMTRDAMLSCVVLNHLKIKQDNKIYLTFSYRMTVLFGGLNFSLEKHTKVSSSRVPLPSRLNSPSHSMGKKNILCHTVWKEWKINKHPKLALWKQWFRCGIFLLQIY